MPESLAYYRVGRHRPQDHPFVSEISNGCALGGCVEEAALYGLLELAERDAFLLTWYAQMPAAAVDLYSARDRRLGLLADHIHRSTGYRVEVFDVTGAEGIPSFWAAAVDTRPESAPHRPRVLCSGGSGLDPERGIIGALHELVTAIEAYQLIYPQRHADAARMREDPELVRLMDDHALLYCDPLAARRLDFLLSPTGPCTPTGWTCGISPPAVPGPGTATCGRIWTSWSAGSRRAGWRRSSSTRPPRSTPPPGSRASRRWSPACCR
ncbi:hypothetical protein GXW82_15445 [Streptacidiphilus sp. 4-A2]|nr:hypothetical protein [Streptacidiphilus sp. 4-A2]